MGGVIHKTKNMIKDYLKKKLAKSTKRKMQNFIDDVKAIVQCGKENVFVGQLNGMATRVCN